MVPVGGELRTTRLRLVPMTATLLDSFGRDIGSVEQSLGLDPAGLQLPEELGEELAQSVPLIMSRMAQHPAEWLWDTMWLIILAAERRIVGGMGFAGPPNADGEVLAGYWIDAAHRRRGYMSEALGGLIDWAFRDQRVTRITANAPVHNLASQRVLLKQGFVRAGEREGLPLYVLDRLIGSPRSG